MLALLLQGALPATSLAQPNQNTGVAGTAIYVPTNGTVRLQMSSKKPIKRVANPREAVLSIRTVFGDPTTILLTGQQSDVTRLDLEDVDGLKETYEVVVQRDIENLKAQLKRAAPTAAIVPTPISDSTVILNGTVANPEDVDIVTRVATSLGFTVINAMRVGGVQQVQLDVVIATVSRSDFRAMTFDFLTNSRNFYFGQNVGGAIGAIPTAGAGGAISPLAFGGPLVGNVGNANVLFGTLHSSYGFLAFLQALRSEAVAKFIAEPHQVTTSGRPSNLHSGGQQAIPSGGGINGVGATFVPFGTDINVLPIVLGNGKIYLEIDARVEDLAASSINIGGANVANRTSNSVTTTVELESGQTFVIGGIMTHRVQGNTDKIPVIGDLPFFGTFFSSKSFRESEEEIIILVTPRLVDAQDCGQTAKVLPGQETRRPDDFELFLEGILEAPRGQREVFQGNHYVPAYKNGPSAEQYPCATNGPCGIFSNRGVCNTGCTTGGCATGNCASGCNGGCASGPVGATPLVARPDEMRMPAGPAAKVEINVSPLPETAPRPLNLPTGLGAPGGEPKE